MVCILSAMADPRVLKGRGARSNTSSRFDREKRVRMDDGWTGDDDSPPALRTEVFRDASRTIITRNASPDISFNQSINPYRGCEHGCIYCFARPTHAFLGFSPGLDFESKILVKPDAAKLLEAELRKPSYRPQPIAIGTNTDPYQPVEREYRLTRSILEVLARFRHPVAVVTKSALITRDIDILAPMAAEGLAKVALSITTLDRKLARKLEPRAATPQRRLETMAALSDAGIPTAVMVAPVIPALNDAEIEAILAEAAKAGATQAGYILLRLPLEIKDLFNEWLEVHVPDKAKHVMSLLKSMRGGKEYDSRWGVRMRGSGPYAQLLGQRFRLAVRRLGLNQNNTPLDTGKFRRPREKTAQLALAI
ncbi:MAG: PA0069 family radical SAM protein [Proteobacteria bacterium]|nr:PA0069 family radical SAM protein [Pseudomonadota bacterium]